MLYTDIMFMFISSKNINGTLYCVFNYCATADHKSHTLAVGPTQFTAPHQTRQNSPVCVVSGVPV